MLNHQKILNKYETCKVSTPEVWLVQQSSEKSVSLQLSWDDGDHTCELLDGVLLLLNQVSVSPSNGLIEYRPLRLEVLSKLLVFLDEAFGSDITNHSLQHWSLIKLKNSQILNERKPLEYWFLHQFMRPSPAFSFLLTLLRQSESYWLVRFLLSQSKSGTSLMKLGKNYGVSYSHFRRLCNNALGGRTKYELRIWRMAQSLLENADGGDSLTQLAVNNGYASASHFSNDIRELIGVSPRRLSNIIQLASLNED